MKLNLGVDRMLEEFSDVRRGASSVLKIGAAFRQFLEKLDFRRLVATQAFERRQLDGTLWRAVFHFAAHEAVHKERGT